MFTVVISEAGSATIESPSTSSITINDDDGE